VTQIQLLDDLEAEFARLAAQPRRRRPPLRALAIALGALVLLVSIAYAVPPTRAALDDLTSAFSGWVEGNEELAPGRALRPADDAPEWVRESGGRLIAETAGAGLYVTRQPMDEGTYLMFSLGTGVGMGNTIDGWREEFENHAVKVLGPGTFGISDRDGSGEIDTTMVDRGLLDAEGRVPLMGLTARSVDRVEVRYVSGPPVTASGLSGGFVVLVDAWRPPSELVAYDAAGRELERVDVRYLDLRYYCDKQPGICP
jgi:hypothetical protein